MKSFKSLILTGLLLAAATSSYAVKAIDNGTQFGSGEDSIRCMENVSLLNSYFKIKSYEEAYNSFKIVFDECPQAAGRTLYNNGVTLIKYKLNNEKDAAKFWKPENYTLALQAAGFIKGYEGPWDKEALEAALEEFIRSNEWPMGKVMNCLRLALVGASSGLGIADIVTLIGKEEFARRIDSIVKTLGV